MRPVTFLLINRVISIPYFQYSNLLLLGCYHLATMQINTAIA